MPSYIENRFERWDEGKPLQIHEKEWECAKKAVKFILFTDNSKKRLPFKLSRKLMQELYAKNPSFFQESKNIMEHSFFAIPDTTAPDGFKLAVMARGKAYTPPGKTKIKEGIVGTGGFGVVKIVQWEDGTQDAVKIFEAVDNNNTESSIMRQLGVLKEEFVRERNEETPWVANKTIKDKQYTIQTLHPGQQLYKYLTNKRNTKEPITTASKLSIAIAAATAIKGLHDKNILHCDIKPENFIINPSQDPEKTLAVVVPIDFGLSKILNNGMDEIEIDTASGTHGYMAPEITQLGRYSRNSDVYALGHMFKTDLKLEQVNDPLKNLISRMLDADPKNRPKMSEVIELLTVLEKLELKKSTVYKKSYSQIEKYKNEKDLKSKSFTFLSNFRIKSNDQLVKVATLKQTLDKSIDESIDESIFGIQNDVNTINKILTLLKENQDLHTKTTLSLASSFNLKTIQNLPDNLQQGVLKELNLDNNKDLLKSPSYSNRKILATALQRYVLRPPSTPSSNEIEKPSSSNLKK